MYKTLIIFVTLFSVTISAQAIKNEQLIKSASDQLMVKLTGSATEDCIYDVEGGFPLSHFTISSEPEWVVDFDGDGEKDVLVRVMDEGMGGGGNAFGFEYNILLMKKGRIDKVLTIYGGAKYSNAYLEVTSVDKKKIYATCTENPMTAGSINFKDDKDLKSVDLVFEYRDGQILEQAYADCPVSKGEKQIFRDDIKFAVERGSKMTELYEPMQTETLYLDEAKTDYISATLGGCQNLALNFRYELPYEESMRSNSSLSKTIYRNFLFLLDGYSCYSTEVKDLLEKFKKTSVDSNEKHLIEMTIPLKNNWKAYILMSNYFGSEKQCLLELKLTKVDNIESNDFWDRMKR